MTGFLFITLVEWLMSFLGGNLELQTDCKLIILLTVVYLSYFLEKINKDMKSCSLKNIKIKGAYA